MEFEDILSQIGVFGKYQKLLLYLFLIPAAILSSMLSNPIYLTLRPDHWCSVPELANFSYGEQHRLIRPVIYGSAKRSKPPLDSCSMHDIDYRQVARELSLSAITNDTRKLAAKKCDSGWIYDRSHYWDSAVMHYNFVCDERDGINLLLTMRLIGCVVGTPLFGLISDIWGRRIAYLLALIIASVSSVSPLALKDYTAFVICQFVCGLTYPAILYIPFILVIEFMGAAHRAKVAACLWIGIIFGASLQSLIIYFIPHWIWITAINTASILPFILAFRLIPESPLWLICRQTEERVTRLLRTIIRINGKTVPPDLLSLWLHKVMHYDDRSSIGDSQSIVEEKEEISAPKVVARKKLIIKYLKTTLLLHMWIISLLCFIINLITNKIFENAYKIRIYDEALLNQTLLTAIETPAILAAWILMQRRLGRRWSNSITLTVIGLTLISLAVVPKRYQTVTLALSLLGKLLNKVSLVITCVQVVEQNPTKFRCLALTTNASVATLVVTVSNYIYSHDNYNKWLLLIIFSALSITVGFLSTFLTETLNENLPQSVSSAEKLITSQKYSSLAVRECDKKVNLFVTISKWNINENDDFDKT